MTVLGCVKDCDPGNTASDVWADTAYRSAANQAFLEKAGKVSRIHHKKPRGRPMPQIVARANARKVEDPLKLHWLWIAGERAIVQQAD